MAEQRVDAAEPTQDSVGEARRRTAPASPAIPSLAVRVGLARVTGLAQATAERVFAARALRDFASLADFTDRVRAPLPELEALILAGAFDWTRRTRPSLLLEARAGAAAWKRRAEPAPALVAPDGAVLATEARAPVAVPELPEFELAERVRSEFQATGLWFSAHPLEVWIEAGRRHGAVAAAQLPDRVGRHVEVVGLPCARRRVQTRSGETMLFLTLADHSGLAECVLFPAAYRRCVMATRGGVLRAQGRVDDTLGAVTLTAERIEVLA